jgi:DNA-directed RNA polymerase subunit H (RpoH/RPB5)
MFRLGFDCCRNGVYGLSEEESLEERKARILIKLRKYKLVKKEKLKDKISYLVKTPRDKQKALIWCIPEEGTVGILSTNHMYKAMKETNAEKGIIITSGRYTHAAKLNAKKKEIELIPRTFPSFDIFENEMVPKHEILTPKERKQLLTQYRIEPYQLPQIKTSDPTVKAIGAKRGDILRIIRKSTTAGTHIAYRYVVE